MFAKISPKAQKAKMQQEFKLIVPVDSNSDFSIHNIPFGVFHLNSEPSSAARCASRIGDLVIDLAALEADGHLKHGAFGAQEGHFFN